MAEAQKDNDQSMDDILASIRKIISDDGSPIPSTNSSDASVQASMETEKAPLGASGPLDDLSDIFEQSEVVPKVDGRTGEVESNVPAAQTAWRHDNGVVPAEPSSGSLTNKLASLGGAANSAPVADISPEVEVVPVATTADVGPQAQEVSGSEDSQANAMSLEDTLENVRKVAAVASTPEVVQSAVTMPVSTPEPTAVEPKQVGASHSAVSEVPKEQTETADAGELDVDAPVYGSAVETVATTGSDTKAAVPATNEPSATSLAGGPSIEVLVTAALKPMLQEWLDANLPQLVEEKLQEELKRRVK